MDKIKTKKLSIRENNNLTPRELDILRLLASKNKTKKEIAKILMLSRSTVATHTSMIYLKLQVNNRGHAVYKGIKEGLIAV